MNDKDNDSPVATIDICADGPLIVNTAAEIDGTTVDAGAALCRCGQSSNKPYCDGSHNAAGFKDAGAVEARGETESAPSSHLTVKLAKNGPILCSGPLTVRSADGSATYAGAKAALCRCGASTNKPFCDGTHGKIEFQTG